MVALHFFSCKKKDTVVQDCGMRDRQWELVLYIKLMHANDQVITNYNDKSRRKIVYL